MKTKITICALALTLAQSAFAVTTTIGGVLHECTPIESRCDRPRTEEECSGRVFSHTSKRPDGSWCRIDNVYTKTCTRVDGCGNVLSAPYTVQESEFAYSTTASCSDVRP